MISQITETNIHNPRIKVVPSFKTLAGETMPAYLDVDIGAKLQFKSDPGPGPGWNTIIRFPVACAAPETLSLRHLQQLADEHAADVLEAIASDLRKRAATR